MRAVAASQTENPRKIPANPPISAKKDIQLQAQYCSSTFSLLLKVTCAKVIFKAIF